MISSKVKMWALACASLALGAGCVPSRKAKVVVDADFLEHADEMDALFDGGGQWENKGLGFAFTFVSEKHETVDAKDTFWHADIIYVVRMHGDECNFAPSGKRWGSMQDTPILFGYTRHGFLTSAKGICLNVKNMEAADPEGGAASMLAATFAHELGHVYGLKDLPGDEPAVMAPATFRAGVQPVDVAHMRDALGD